MEEKYRVTLDLGRALASDKNLLLHTMSLPEDVNDTLRTRLPPLLLAHQGPSPEVNHLIQLLSFLPKKSHNYTTMAFKHDTRFDGGHHTLVHSSVPQTQSDKFEVQYSVFSRTYTDEVSIKITITGPSLHGIALGFSKFVYPARDEDLINVSCGLPSHLPTRLQRFMSVGLK